MIEIRDHVARGHIRRRALEEARRSVRPLGTLAFVFAVTAACAAFLLLQIDKPALVSSHTYRFDVTDATGVQPGVDEVRFKGIPAGKVTSVRLDGTQPVITVALETSFGRVYRNATAQLRPNTPLQDMYLDITSRGTPDAGLASTTAAVPATQTATPVSISDVLDVFGTPERTRLQQLLGALGNGLADRGQSLRTSFAELVPFVREAGQLTGQLDLHSRLTKQLVHNVGLLTTTLGDRATQIRTLVAEGAKTMGTLGDNAPAVEQTLTELPPTIATADQALTALQGVLPSVTGASRSLEPVAGQLPQALADIRRLTRVARPAITALQQPVSKLVPLAGALVPVSKNLSQSVTTLLPQVPVINETVSGIEACLPSLYGFFDWDASMAKFGDARGGAPRGNAVGGGQSIGAPNPFEFPEKSCTPGQAIGGRLPQAGDYR